MNNRTKFLTMMALATLGITSCKENYFDENEYESMVRSSFPVANVDRQHTWATIGSAEATISVNLKAGQTYSVKIYDQNPIGAQGPLSLLGEGTVNNGETLTTLVNYPLSQSYVYVALFDGQGYMTVYPQLVSDGKITLNADATTPSSARRAISTSFKFPSAPADADFASVRDADAELINGYKQGSTFYIDASVSGNGNKIQPNGNNVRLYVEGNVSLVQRGFYLPGYATLYLLPGAKLTLPDDFSFGQYMDKIYVASGAELVVGGTLQLAANCMLYNRGTVTTDSIAVTNAALLYNEGVIDLTGGFAVTNNNSVIVNDSLMRGRTMGVYGSGHLQNNATMVIGGLTEIISNSNTWVNNGSYTTRDFDYQAAAFDVVNNCKLYVTNLMSLHQSDWMQNCFQNDAGASVETKDFYINTSNVKMGAGSVIKVSGTATMHETKEGYGIKVVGDDYAVFQATNIVMGSSNQSFEILYDGKLYVASDNHFAQGNDGQADHPYYVLQNGAALTSLNGADVHVVDNGCGAAYQGTPGNQPEAKSFSMRYCFEDNFPEMGDYDFNDAVITVTPTTDGTTTVKLRVSLDAVGATKQIAAALRIKDLDDSDVASCTRDGDFDADFPTNASTRIIPAGDVMLPVSAKTTNNVVLPLFNNAHWSLGRRLASDGSVENWFLNTVKRDDGLAEKRNDIDPVVVTYTFTLKDKAKAALFKQENIDVFIVESHNGGYYEVHTVPFKTDEILVDYMKNIKNYYTDNIPWAICVPGNDFLYPLEWHIIGVKNEGVITGAYQEYGHSFAEWAEDHTKATDWYKYPTASQVYQ